MLDRRQKAPDFQLPSTSGNLFHLSKDAKGKALVLYFYPKDNTKVCTQQACNLRDNFEILKELDILIIGISTDSVKKHLEFKERNNLPFELLSDRDGKVSKLYKAHIPFLNLSKRVTYLLNTDHEIVMRLNDLFSAESHIKETIENLNLLKS